MRQPNKITVKDNRTDGTVIARPWLTVIYSRNGHYVEYNNQPRRIYVDYSCGIIQSVIFEDERVH